MRPELNDARDARTFPAARIFCGWDNYQQRFHVGLAWMLNPNAVPGEVRYLRQFELWCGSETPWRKWGSFAFGWRFDRYR